VLQVETREYALPEALVGKPIALIGTMGQAGVSALPDTVAAGGAQLLGELTFGECFRYTSVEQWRADEKRHAVTEGSEYDWAPAGGTEKWGWVVKSVRRFDSPAAAPALTRQSRSLFTLGSA